MGELFETQSATPGHKPGDPYPLLDTLKTHHFNPLLDAADTNWQGPPDPPLKDPKAASQGQDK